MSLIVDASTNYAELIKENQSNLTVLQEAQTSALL